MARRLIVLLTASVLFSVFSLPASVYAQAPVPQEEAELSGTRKQVATIIFAGLAGAILGLSTLSFHGRPQDKLSNIAVGAAIGIFAGAAYTTYKAARKPYEVYEYSFNSELDQRLNVLAANQTTFNAGWSWTF